jgi:hypothetical protein
MYSDKMQLHPTRDSHVPSWYPIQSSPSQDMWELPSNGTAASCLEPNGDQVFSDQIDDRGLQNEQVPSLLDMEASMQAGTRNEPRTPTIGENKRWVLSDTTNICQRMNNVSPTENRIVRRSNFS